MFVFNGKIIVSIFLISSIYLFQFPLSHESQAEKWHVHLIITKKRISFLFFILYVLYCTLNIYLGKILQQHEQHAIDNNKVHYEAYYTKTK